MQDVPKDKAGVITLRHFQRFCEKLRAKYAPVLPSTTATVTTQASSSRPEAASSVADTIRSARRESSGSVNGDVWVASMSRRPSNVLLPALPSPHASSVTNGHVMSPLQVDKLHSVGRTESSVATDPDDDWIDSRLAKYKQDSPFKTTIDDVNVTFVDQPSSFETPVKPEPLPEPVKPSVDIKVSLSCCRGWGWVLFLRIP
jgi:hypothetical protein